MKLDELIGSLQTFELNLKQNKKDKCIALRVEEQDDKGNTDVDESFVLLIKKFTMFLNEMNRKKNSHKSKKHASAIESKKQHIEESNDSQEDDDDYMRNNVAFQITTKKDTLAAVTTDVATKDVTRIDFEDVADCEEQNFEPCIESDFDLSDEEEPSTEDIQKAYQEMYDNWIKVCNVNKSLKDKLFKLADENAKLKSVSANWKNLLKEKK